MYLSDAVSLVNSFSQFDLDNYAGESPTNANVTSQINWASRLISKKLEMFNPVVVFTLTAGIRTYDLRSTSSFSVPVVKPMQVVIAGSLLLDARQDRPGLWSISEFERLNPNWRTDANGVPDKAAWHTDKLVLNPPPNTATASLNTHYVSGLVLSADLTYDANASTTALNVPVELHECVCYLAAVKAATPQVSEQEAWQRVSAYDQAWREEVEAQRRLNRESIQDWGTTSGYSQSDYVWT